MGALYASQVLITVLSLAGAFATVQPNTAPGHVRDPAAIQRTLERFLDSWNRHDPHANAVLYTDDADVTNVLGDHIHGRSAIEAASVETYAGVFRKSQLNGQVRSIRFLTSGLAAVDVDWQMTGAVLPSGPAPDRKGLMDWVMVRQADGSWLIEIFHNADFTNVLGAAK